MYHAYLKNAKTVDGLEKKRRSVDLIIFPGYYYKSAFEKEP